MVWRSALAVVALALAVGGCAQPSWQQQDTTDKPRIHVMIRFDDTTIQPDVARIKAGGTVSWVTYTTEYHGSVVLPPGVRQDLHCDVRPDFMEISGGGLQSIPIGGDDDDLDLPCPLKPGTYDYQIFLQGAGGLGQGLQNPEVTMKGSIIVE